MSNFPKSWEMIPTESSKSLLSLTVRKGKTMSKETRIVFGAKANTSQSDVEYWLATHGKYLPRLDDKGNPIFDKNGNIVSTENENPDFVEICASRESLEKALRYNRIQLGENDPLRVQAKKDIRDALDTVMEGVRERVAAKAEVFTGEKEIPESAFEESCDIMLENMMELLYDAGSQNAAHKVGLNLPKIPGSDTPAATNETESF